MKFSHKTDTPGITELCDSTEKQVKRLFGKSATVSIKKTPQGKITTVTGSTFELKITLEPEHLVGYEFSIKNGEKLSWIFTKDTDLYPTQGDGYTAITHEIIRDMQKFIDDLSRGKVLFSRSGKKIMILVPAREFFILYTVGGLIFKLKSQYVAADKIDTKAYKPLT